MILAGVFGLVIGAALGLLGAGGSILAVPALVYGVGQPLPAALFGSLLVVGVSAVGGLVARLRAGVIRWPIAGVFAAAGVPTAFAGTAIGRLLPDQGLLIAFSVLMAVVAVRMLREDPDDEPGGACRTGGGGINRRSCLPKALAAGAAVGLLTGLFGVGGGFIIVPALTLLLGLTAAEAVATSLVIVTLTSAAGLAAHAAAAASVDYPVIGVFAAAALLASLAAGRVSNRLPGDVLRRGFAYLILVIAAGVAAAAVFAPAALSSG